VGQDQAAQAGPETLPERHFLDNLAAPAFVLILLAA
jgi:hypothetical protein